GDASAPERINKYVRFGASPRGAQGLVLLGKVRALLDGRYNVSFRDVAMESPAVLRHRLIRNFEAEADDVDGDALVAEVGKATRHVGCIRGPPSLRRRRRRAFPRLVDVRAARPPDDEALPRRGGPRRPSRARPQRVDGFRRSDEGALRQARAGVDRLRRAARD